jgi:hypothetical protein
MCVCSSVYASRHTLQGIITHATKIRVLGKRVLRRIFRHNEGETSMTMEKVTLQERYDLLSAVNKALKQKRR